MGAYQVLLLDAYQVLLLDAYQVLLLDAYQRCCQMVFEMHALELWMTNKAHYQRLLRNSRIVTKTIIPIWLRQEAIAAKGRALQVWIGRVPELVQRATDRTNH